MHWLNIYKKNTNQLMSRINMSLILSIEYEYNDLQKLEAVIIYLSGDRFRFSNMNFDLNKICCDIENSQNKG